MKMLITNKQSGTNVHEIADGIYRINTPVIMEGGPGGFSFNQFLIAVRKADVAQPAMDYYSHTPNTRMMLERLAAAAPTTLACMHGSAWRGDGAKLLLALADALAA
jgi:hypothetical protein